MIAKFCDCVHFLWIFLTFRTKVPVDASKDRERERERERNSSFIQRKQ